MQENRPIFTVSRLNQAVRLLLESQLTQIWISGEISNLSMPVSGHWYFTLKDLQAQVRCAMFRTSNRKVTFRPQNGQQVLVRANVTLYEPRGDYQLVVEGMQADGAGDLQQQFEQLKMQLAAEGLFAQSAKKPLPEHPKQVGIITSASGAALQDMLQILQRRDPMLPVVIYPVMVQGNEAPAQIIRALTLANARRECDVLIVGRGGGALEDLLAFNNEAVARAIFASQLPVISAVGHETDVTIADFVADLRAPTPSAAAELVSRDQQALLTRLSQSQHRLQQAAIRQLQRQQQHLERLQHRLLRQHPQARLQRQQMQLDDLQHRLQQATERLLQRQQQRTDSLLHRLHTQTPRQRIDRSQQQLDQLTARLSQQTQHLLRQRGQALGLLGARLQAVSPLATLARGYAVVQDEQRQLITSVQQVQAGDSLQIRLSDGVVHSRVERTNE
ncbi:exodeoxyribonuclease VII large subunit [Plesiomonas shigelloides]|uniref:Exodeoxyribonuclease 7 large subunit n=1 Tax=Plesiomonas shigelloides 302-73 TaxID=1315976 RepID=R8ATN0_PLESH|nr:exodeoxyribonuclease VII large subunit [Plesiomonas shigelloides]EON89678.1 exodeoxyribonuclease VII large subunit [Plesiomonas shigelloides 302-73]